MRFRFGSGTTGPRRAGATLLARGGVLAAQSASRSDFAKVPMGLAGFSLPTSRSWLWTWKLNVQLEFTLLRRHGVVFYAHPRHHMFSWVVADNVANGSIRMNIFRLAFGLHKRQLAGALKPLIERLGTAVSTDSWQRAAAHQRPSQFWDHAHGVTEYQVWTRYRVAYQAT
uniref:RxLR effector candidate protein n=1 Tax=Hyaloperonospora arabidopsidis (strain Emoy2) TaxID=559515 RepID=M4B4U7_HYAAE